MSKSHKELSEKQVRAIFALMAAPAITALAPWTRCMPRRLAAAGKK
jgi:hypothetical protein